MTLVSVAEYARRMDLSEGTVRRLAREGFIPATKLGRRLWRIDADAPLPRVVPNGERGKHPTKGRLR
jgi:excisionase family DNA binding protein